MTTLLTEEQTLLCDSVRDLLAAELSIDATRRWLDAGANERAEMVAGTWRRFAEQGWLGIAWPESCGGAGLGFLEQSLVLREMGRVLVPSAYVSTHVAGTLLLEEGSRESLETVARITAGECSLAVVPPVRSESGLAGGATGKVCDIRCEEGQAGLVLAGEAPLVADATFADFLLVAAEESDAGWSWMLVAADASGLRCEEQETMDGTRPLSRLVFDRVPARRVGSAGSGDALWDATAPTWWLALAAESVGGCEQVLADSVAYAKDREQFGRPIGANQAIQHRCADMFVRSEAARAITWHAAREMDQGSAGARLACSMAKAHATEAFLEVARDGIQVHGGVGFTWEFNCHFFYKRARASEICGGHPEEHREAVAQEAGL